VITPEDAAAIVVQAVADDYGVELAQMTGARRYSGLAGARHVAAYILYCHLGVWSYPEVGRMLGRHHTTVIHSVRVVRRTLADPERGPQLVDRMTRILERAGRAAGVPMFNEEGGVGALKQPPS
jgi:chromosomal replication initiation ATPase DnaA